MKQFKDQERLGVPQGATGAAGFATAGAKRHAGTVRAARVSACAWCLVPLFWRGTQLTGVRGKTGRARGEKPPWR